MLYKSGPIMFLKTPLPAATLMGYLLSISSIVFAQNYPIGQLSIQLTDAARNNRQVPVEIFYPATVSGAQTPVAAGRFPVIVFGHGFSMNFDAYSNFWNMLVPNGFILIFPKTEIGPLPFPSHSAFAEDLLFAAHFLQIQDTIPGSPFYGKVSSRTAVMGHSMGGGCSFLAAAAAPHTITTVVGFAPAETNPSAIAAASGVTIPALIFHGSSDNVTPANGNSLSIFNALQSSCKSYVSITNGSHCRFAESNLACESGETLVCLLCSFIPRTQQHMLTFQLLLPWLRFFLKEECTQWDVFQNLSTSHSDISVQNTCIISQPDASVTITVDTVLCPGDSVIFSANGNDNFLWSTGDTTSSLTVFESGTYFLIASNAFDCRDTSSVIRVVQLQPDTPKLIASGDTTLCEGENLLITLNKTFSTYLWSDGSADSFIVADMPGSYFAVVTDSAGCSYSSDTITLTILPNPVYSSFVFRDDSLLIETSAPFIAWYLNDTLIYPGRENFWIPTEPGNYYAILQDSAGCFVKTETITVKDIPTSLLEKPVAFIQIYPNPAAENLCVKGITGAVSLLDIYGRKKEILRWIHSEMLDVSALPAGCYLLKAETPSGIQIIRFIKR